MLTTALILLPLVGALVVAIAPLPRTATAGLAFLVALMEVGLWIVSAARFDFDDGGLQLGTSREWVESLGISYTVGFYGFSLWLAGATAIVSAAAIGYAMWVGRDRPRAYHALMLFLTGAVVATFASQDLLLFPRLFTPTVPCSTSSSPTTSTYGIFSSFALRMRAPSFSEASTMSARKPSPFIRSTRRHA